MLVVTPLHAGALTLLYGLLTALVIQSRGTEKIGLGYGDSADLEQRIRAHGNFIEYVPLGLILIGFLEANGHPLWMLHFYGVALLVGRVLHAFALYQSRNGGLLRIVGMALTLVAVLGAGLANLWGAVSS